MVNPPSAADPRVKEFPSDEEIGTSVLFRFFAWLILPFAIVFHSYSISGTENIPDNEGALLVGMHTTHNQDLLLGPGFYFKTGRVIRGLWHRTLYRLTPILGYIGGHAGEREVATELLQAGKLVAVIPGGAEEALCGHENSYKLHWESSSGRKRQGFALVALSVGKPVSILPMFSKNAEEMRFNPLHWLWNCFGLADIWWQFLNWVYEVNDTLGKVAFVVASFIWYISSYLGIPVPVQVTTFVGKPIRVHPGDDPAEVVDKVKSALEDLIREHQPFAPGKCYLHALKERFPWFQTPTHAKAKLL